MLGIKSELFLYLIGIMYKDLEVILNLKFKTILAASH